MSRRVPSGAAERYDPAVPEDPRPPSPEGQSPPGPGRPDDEMAWGAPPPAPVIPPTAAPSAVPPGVPFPLSATGAAWMLRPRGVGELLDAAISLYRRHWLTFMGIVAILIVPFTVAQQYVTATFAPSFQEVRTFQDLQEVQAANLRLLVVGSVFVVVNLLIVVPLLTAALVRAVGDSYLGERATVGEAYRGALSRAGAVLGAVMLQLLIVVAIVAPVFFLIFVSRSGELAVLLFLGLGLVFTFILVRLLFAPSAVVIEGAGPTRALGRAWDLSRGAFWRTLGVMLLANLLAGVVNLILLLPVTLAQGPDLSEGWALRAVAASLAQVITTPFVTMMPVLLYFDLRIRKEGFDLAIMARELSRPAS